MKAEPAAEGVKEEPAAAAAAEGQEAKPDAAQLWAQLEVKKEEPSEAGEGDADMAGGSQGGEEESEGGAEEEAEAEEALEELVKVGRC